MTEPGPNPNTGIGSNYPPLAKSIAAEQGDFATVVTAYLGDEYAVQPTIVKELLAECAILVKDAATGELVEIEDGDDEKRNKVVSLIKRIRDRAKGLKSFHEKEGIPYLRGKQAVDQFFFGLIDKLAKRDKNNKPGAADVLQDLLTRYDTKKLEEERARRQREAVEAVRVAREEAERAATAAKVAEDARLAAERARKPEMVAAKGAVADRREAAAQEAKVDAILAQGQADEARIATLAKPADIMRHRGDDGTLSTMGTEPFAEVVDERLLDKEALWAFIRLEEKEKALRAWAKNTGYTRQMPGATIGKRPKSVVR